MHPLLEDIGIETLFAPENEILKKVFNDNLVTLRAQELMVAHFAGLVVQQMLPLERAALLKRICPPVAQNSVRWSMAVGQHSNRPLILARFRAEEIIFDGDPENAAILEFHGERPPVSILQQYAAAYDPNNKPQLDAAYWHARTAKAPLPTPGPFLD